MGSFVEEKCLKCFFGDDDTAGNFVVSAICLLPFGIAVGHFRLQFLWILVLMDRL